MASLTKLILAALYIVALFFGTAYIHGIDQRIQAEDRAKAVAEASTRAEERCAAQAGR
jgi:uncharacterized membrane protein